MMLEEIGVWIINTEKKKLKNDTFAPTNRMIVAKIGI